MKLFWLKTQFTWIASLSEFDNDSRGKIVKRVKPEAHKLCSRLLGIGGEKAVVLFNEDFGFCEALIELGQITQIKKLHIKKGEDRECHSNSASLWLSDKKKYKLVTGFGLSDDNIWRRHSWVSTVDDNLIETTIARKIYFGITLNNKVAKSFADFYLS
jgi:hypothetical protein